MSSIQSDRLATYASMLGGFRTFDFSQAKAFQLGDTTQPDQGKTYKMVLRGGKPMGGVCATICAFWVVFHAQQDAGNYKKHGFTDGRSVWDYLFKEGGVNIGAAQNITVEHHLSSGDQIAYFENFMKKFKVVRRKNVVTGDALSVELPISRTQLMRCADAITSRTGGYKLISLKKQGGGHMVAAYCGGSDVVFMDPNYGEFWLPSKAAFKAWFQFFVNNTYDQTYGKMIVRDYALAA
jgi:hypothetical protein